MWKEVGKRNNEKRIKEGGRRKNEKKKERRKNKREKYKVIKRKEGKIKDFNGRMGEEGRKNKEE